MLEITLDERKKQLLGLNDFTNNINQEIANITSTLGWTVESISNDNTNFLTCPYDPSHRITEACLEKHLHACQWKAEGYQKLDISFPESALPLNSSSSFQFDEELQDEVLRQAKEQNPEMKTGSDQRLIPRTSDRLISDFTSDERKALYEYVIAHTVKPDMGRDIADINKPKPQDKDNKEISYLEMLVLERNLKRRRAKHKGVHTNKKSHIEIIREVINQQMEIYTEYILEQKDVDTRIAYSSEQNPSTYSEKQKLIATNHYDKSSASTHFSQREKNGHHRTNTIYDQRQKNTMDKTDSESIKCKKYKKHLSDSKEIKKEKRNEHRHRSRSRDYKSHKKHKHKSKDKHIKKKHKSRNHEESSSHEEGHSKYSDFKTKNR